MGNFKVVVARYNEDVEWCKPFPCIIYNKGGALPNTIALPNIGREAHTYLHHIIENYDNLDDYTAFVQGDPFDHSPNILRNLRATPVTPFTWLSERIILTTTEYDGDDPTLPMKEFTMMLYGKLIQRTFKFGEGAQFIVSRDAIRRKPKAFYQFLLYVVSREPVRGSAVDRTKGPWVIERFWQPIFTH